MDEDRPAQPGLRLELGEQAVDVVDVLGPLDLGDHHHVELVADLGDGGDDVVEHPRRVERVDARPELRVGVVPRLADLDEPGAGVLLLRRRDGVLEVGQQHVDGRRDVGTLATIFGLCGGRKWMTRDGRNGISRTGSGAPIASGRKKSFGGRTGAGYGPDCAAWPNAAEPFAPLWVYLFGCSPSPSRSACCSRPTSTA